MSGESRSEDPLSPEALRAAIVAYCRSHDAYLIQATQKIRNVPISSDAPEASYPAAKAELWKIAKKCGYAKDEARRR